MIDGRMLKLIYTFFLGLLIAVLIGVGVNTFYEPPTAPIYPIQAETYGKNPTDEQLKAQREFDSKNQKYQEELRPYNRTYQS